MVMKLKLLILLVVGLSLFASTPSWSVRQCTGPRCVNGRECRDLVNAKGLKGAAWKAEYGKCTEVGAADYK
jgi:hypothetical protein